MKFKYPASTTLNRARRIQTDDQQGEVASIPCNRLIQASEQIDVETMIEIVVIHASRRTQRCVCDARSVRRGGAARRMRKPMRRICFWMDWNRFWRGIANKRTFRRGQTFRFREAERRLEGCAIGRWDLYGQMQEEDASKWTGTEKQDRGGSVSSSKWKCFDAVEHIE